MKRLIALGALALSLTGCAAVEHDAQRSLVARAASKYQAQRAELERERDLLRDLGNDPKMVAKLQAKAVRIDAAYKAERARLAEKVLASR